MAAVFLMQPLGQIVASLVGLVLVIGYGNATDLKNLRESESDPEQHKQAAKIVDSMLVRPQGATSRRQSSQLKEESGTLEISPTAKHP